MAEIYQCAQTGISTRANRWGNLSLKGRRPYERGLHLHFNIFKPGVGQLETAADNLISHCLSARLAPGKELQDGLKYATFPLPEHERRNGSQRRYYLRPAKPKGCTGARQRGKPPAPARERGRRYFLVSFGPDIAQLMVVAPAGLY